MSDGSVLKRQQLGMWYQQKCFLFMFKNCISVKTIHDRHKHNHLILVSCMKTNITITFSSRPNNIFLLYKTYIHFKSIKTKCEKISIDVHELLDCLSDRILQTNCGCVH